MSEQSRDQWAMELLTDTLALEWYSSDPQARKVADAAAVEVERLQAAKTKAEEAELAAAQEMDEVKAERDGLGRLVHDKAVALQRAEAERDALAAHVKAGRETMEYARQWVPQHVWTQLWMWKEEEPATSLANLKAEWQAEALEYAADNIAPVFRRELKAQADELRRQAEEPAE